MTTYPRIAEFSKINPDFYDKLTYTQILFFVNSALGHFRFFFDNTSEDQLIIPVDSIEQIDPNRRIEWEKITASEREQVLQMLTQRLGEEGYAVKIVQGGELCIERSGVQRKRVPSEQRLKNNRDVPLIRKLLRLGLSRS